MIGLPGTGLGGIFYILLVIWMAVRETRRALRSVSHPSRWRTIAKLSTLAFAIIAALWLEGWLLYKIFGSTEWHTNPYGVDGRSRELALAAIAPMLAIAPFVVLALLMATIHIARLTLRRVPQEKLTESQNVARLNVKRSST